MYVGNYLLANYVFELLLPASGLYCLELAGDIINLPSWPCHWSEKSLLDNKTVIIANIVFLPQKQ